MPSCLDWIPWDEAAARSPDRSNLDRRYCKNRKFVQVVNRGFFAPFMEVYRAELEDIGNKTNVCFRGNFDENDERELGDRLVSIRLNDTVVRP